jgi:hypothetical protein
MTIRKTTISSSSDSAMGDYPALYAVVATMDREPVQSSRRAVWVDVLRILAVATLVAVALTAIALTQLGGKRGPTSLHEATVLAATCVNASSPFEIVLGPTSAVTEVRPN